jgi:uncharacterized protein
MKPEDLPLLELFTRLREHGLQLGIDEYMTVLRALRAGFGAEDRQALERLCCAVWVKSEREARLFHRLFEQILSQPVVPSEKLSPPEPSESLPEHPAELEREVPSPKPSEPTAEPTKSKRHPSLAMEMDEPSEVVQAVRRSARDDFEMSRPRFSLLTEYFPVTRRQMKQSWRHLRRPVREGPPEELDVEATVEKVAREGILLEPVQVPRRSNRAELALLIDQDGSMVPFHSLSRQLVETARRGGRLGRAGVYYFHDYPDGFFYRNSARSEAESISDALMTIGEQAVVLIVSDAGAARGSFEKARVERTQAFLNQLKQSVRRYAWLNPMPNHRWRNTTAEEIARLVPMFEMNRTGLDAAIDILRERYVQWEKVYPWMI